MRLFEESKEADFNYKTRARLLKGYKEEFQKYFDKILVPVVKELATENSFSFDAHNQLFVSKYLLELPDKKVLENFIRKEMSTKPNINE